MNTATLRSLLRTRLLAVPDLPPIEWEGTRFDETPSVTYVEDEFRGGTTVTQSNGTVEARALYLVTLHTPPQLLATDMDRITDALLNAFEPGRTLTDAARTHTVELLTLDAGALRVMPSGWGYRRLTVGLSAIAFRTTLLTA